jgi:hypothetical protein
MKTVKTLTLLTICVASIALADDFKANNGKEYKNATVTQVEADGIVVRTKTGISKLYFVELSEEVRKQFHYDPEQAATYAAQQAAAHRIAAHQAEASINQRTEQQKQQGEQVAKQQNIQALVSAHQDLLQQEEDLLRAIGRIKNAKEMARRKWLTRPWRYNEPQPDQYQTYAAEANLPLVEGRLQMCARRKSE